MHHKAQEHALKANLEWLSKFKLSGDREKSFLDDRYCLSNFKTALGFTHTEHENTCPFPPQIGSSISTFRGMYLYSAIKFLFDFFLFFFFTTLLQ